MARTGFPQGSPFRRGTRRKVWVARWWEDVIYTDGTLGGLRRSEVIGTVAEFPTRRRAMQVLCESLGSINSVKARPTDRLHLSHRVTPLETPTCGFRRQRANSD
jgi:hypothetical protein